ncbi:unnamed protein product [Echinostoma caproni]|uniref:DUF1279 domain-containing protein n=1 Tax=Echinostoma caproni TaxID=27848 RepID=A0A183BAW9_9TREM|nr:unnamed protein product [Echinostoma caproni]
MITRDATYMFPLFVHSLFVSVRVIPYKLPFFFQKTTTTKFFLLRDCVSAWSSGTGAAGLVGALVYASLTSATSPETTLLILTVVPVAMTLKCSRALVYGAPKLRNLVRSLRAL